MNEEEFPHNVEEEEDPVAFAKRVEEWDKLDSLDHEDENVNEEDTVDWEQRG